LDTNKYQSGYQQIVDGHAYAVAGQDTIPQPAHSYVVGEAKKNIQAEHSCC